MEMAALQAMAEEQAEWVFEPRPERRTFADEHEGALVTCAASAAGLVATGDVSGRVVLWEEVGELKEVPHRLEGAHGAEVTSLAFSPSGSLLVSTSSDGSVCVWKTRAASIDATITEAGATPSRAALFSPDGAHLAIGRENGVVRLWAVAGDEETVAVGRGAVREFFADGRQDPSECTCLAWSPDSRTLACGREDNVVAVVRDGRVAGRLAGHSYSVSCLTFSPDGTSLASGSQDMAVHVWDSETLKRIATCQVRSLHVAGGWVLSLAYSSDSSRIVAGYRGARPFALLWGARTGELLFQLQTGLPASPDMVLVRFDDKDERYIMGATRCGSLYRWTADEGVLVRQTQPTAKVDTGRIRTYRRNAAWRSSGSAVLAEDSRVVSASLNPSGSDLQFVRDFGDEIVYRVVYGAGEATLLCYCSTGDLIMLDVLSGAQLWRVRAHSDGINSAEFCPAKPSVLLTAAGHTARLFLSNEVSAVQHGRDMLHDARVLSAQFSPDSQWIVTINTHCVWVWRHEDGHDEPVAKFGFGDGRSVMRAWIKFRPVLAWSADSLRCVLVSDSGWLLPMEFPGPDAGDGAVPSAGEVQAAKPGGAPALSTWSPRLSRFAVLSGSREEPIRLRVAFQRTVPDEALPLKCEVYDVDTACGEWTRLCGWAYAAGTFAIGWLSDDGSIITLPKPDEDGGWAEGVSVSVFSLPGGEHLCDTHGGEVREQGRALNYINASYRPSGDGRLVMTTVGCAVTFHDARTGDYIGTVMGHTSVLKGVMLSPTASTVALLSSRAHNRVVVYSLARMRARPRPDDAYFLVFHPLLADLPEDAPPGAAEDFARGDFRVAISAELLYGAAKFATGVHRDAVFVRNIVAALLRAPRNIGLANERSDAGGGDTLLHFACRMRRPQILRMLLGSLQLHSSTRGALLTNDAGETVIDVCVRYGSAECLEAVAAYVGRSSRVRHLGAVTRSLSSLCADYPDVAYGIVSGLGLRPAAREVTDGAIVAVRDRRYAEYRGCEELRPRKLWAARAASVMRRPKATVLSGEAEMQRRVDDGLRARGESRSRTAAPGKLLRDGSTTSALHLLPNGIGQAVSLQAMAESARGVESVSYSGGEEEEEEENDGIPLDEHSRGTVAKAKVVPLPGLGSYYGRSRSAHPLYNAVRLNQAAIFGTPAVRATFELKWRKFGRRVLLRQLAVHAALVALFSVLTLATTVDDGHSAARVVLHAVCGTIALHQFAVALPLLMRDTVGSFFATVWGPLHMLSSASVLASCVVFFASDGGRDRRQLAVQSAAVVLMDLRSLHFARGFRTSGRLVRFVSRVVRESAYVALFLVLVILAYAHALALLYTSGDDGDGEFGDFRIVLHVFQSAFGEFISVEELGAAEYPGLAYAHFICFTVLVTVVLINLLIGLMTAAFASASAAIDDETELERARVILEIERTLPVATTARRDAFPTWLHVLEPR